MKPILFETISRAKYDALSIEDKNKKNWQIKEPDGSVSKAIGNLEGGGSGGGADKFVVNFSGTIQFDLGEITDLVAGQSYSDFVNAYNNGAIIVCNFNDKDGEYKLKLNLSVDADGVFVFEGLCESRWVCIIWTEEALEGDVNGQSILPVPNSSAFGYVLTVGGSATEPVWVAEPVSGGGGKSKVFTPTVSNYDFPCEINMSKGYVDQWAYDFENNGEFENFIIYLPNNTGMMLSPMIYVGDPEMGQCFMFHTHFGDTDFDFTLMGSDDNKFYLDRV